MAIPQAFLAMNLTSSVITSKILSKLAFIGLFRISFEISKYYNLSEEESKQYIYLANSKMFNSDMVQEGKDALANTNKANEIELPKVPLLIFATDESTDINDWRKMQYDFLKFITFVIVILRNHYHKSID